MYFLGSCVMMNIFSNNREILVGEKQYNFPSQHFQQLSDCNELLGDFAALNYELEKKGYLYIRGFHDRNDVLEAQSTVIEHI